MNLEKGNRIVLKRLVTGLHPTDPSIHVCSMMANMGSKPWTIELCNDKERVFKVEGEPYFFSYDHVGQVLEA